MDQKTLIKHKMLIGKLKEHFAANPQDKAVILRAKVGENKIFWRAERQEGKVQVTEVRTMTNQFDFAGDDLKEIVSGIKESK